MNNFLIQQEPEDIKASFTFQIHANLTRIRMRQFSAHIPEQEEPVGHGLHLALQHAGKSTRADSSRVWFEVELKLDAFADDELKRLVFHLDCAFELEYQLAEGYQPDASALEAFKNGNAIFNCWPYAREFVQSSTQRLGLMVPPLPLLRLMPKEPASPKAKPRRRRLGAKQKP